MEHLHQAVEGVDTVGKAEDAGGAADKHATRRVSRSVAGVDQNPLTSRTCIRRGSRAPQAADHRRGERAKRGETTSRRRAYSPAGMAGCAPEAGGSSVAMGDCPLSAGKNSTPSVPPGRWAVRRKRINVDIWKKLT